MPSRSSNPFSMPELSRRRFIQAAALSPLVAFLPRGMIAQALAAPTAEPFEFFDAHQAAGAREAKVVRYIDVLLAAFSHDPARIHASGPWSDRSGGDEDYMANFVPLSPFQEASWRKRIAALQQMYRTGIVALDAAAGGDYSTASASKKDSTLNNAGDFRDVLFIHAIEGFLSAPEYGGNQDLVGWKEISFKGDTQPRGYTAKEIGESDGLDPVVPDVLVASVLANLDIAALAIAARRRGGR